MYIHTATIKHCEGDKLLITQRESQLEMRCIQYAWQKLPDTGLPSCINDKSVHIKGLVNDLPLDEKFQLRKLIDFSGTAMKDSAELLALSAIENITDMHDYKKLASLLGKHELTLYNAGRWMTDVEFGRQMLNGVNPVVIKQCTKLPLNFPVTNGMVKGSLSRGKTLNEEMKVSCELVVIIGASVTRIK